MIFVVDDEPHIRDTLKSILQDEGYSVEVFGDAQNLLEAVETHQPLLMLLDIWLPGSDGVQVLKELKQHHPQLPVIMISGHAGIEAAVNSMKHGAFDFLEKPLDLDILLDKVASALPKQQKLSKATPPTSVSEPSLSALPSSVALVETEQKQQTLQKNVVLNGAGLLTGRNTGIILSPLDENAGVVFQCLDGHTLKGHISFIENIENAVGDRQFRANSTVLAQGSSRVRTIEHLMATLAMYGVHNVLIKVDEEIPNFDGSAVNFCKLIEDAGIAQQQAYVKQAVIKEKVLIGTETLDQKHLYIEPFDGFEVRMRVDFPEPIFEQEYTFNAATDDFAKDVAPARSFNTFENIDQAQQSGAVGGGYLNSHIIIHDGKVINTELRFPDEFVRHKILDLIGDLYLLGHPVSGRIFANMTSHGYNQMLVYHLHKALEQQNT